MALWVALTIAAARRLHRGFLIEPQEVQGALTVVADAVSAGAEQLAVLFVHGVGIREPNYARSAVRMLRREYAKATGDPGGRRRPGRRVRVLGARGDRAGGPPAARSAFPDRAAGWFTGLNKLTHRISNGSSLSLVPLALSGLVRHVPGHPADPLADAALGGQQLRRRHRRLPGHPEHPGGVRRGARAVRPGAAPAGRPGAGRAAVRGRAQPGQRHRLRPLLRPAQGAAPSRRHPAGARRDPHLVLHAGQPDRAVDGAVRRLQPSRCRSRASPAPTR